MKGHGQFQLIYTYWVTDYLRECQAEIYIGSLNKYVGGSVKKCRLELRCSIAADYASDACFPDSNAGNQVMAFPEGSRVISTEMVDSLTGEQQTYIIIQPAQGAEIPGSTQGISLTPQTSGHFRKNNIHDDVILAL